MDFYQYKAIDSFGRIRVGKADAINVADLEMRLRKLGLDLVNCKALPTPQPFLLELKSAGDVSAHIAVGIEHDPLRHVRDRPLVWRQLINPALAEVNRPPVGRF